MDKEIMFLLFHHYVNYKKFMKLSTSSSLGIQTLDHIPSVLQIDWISVEIHLTLINNQSIGSFPCQ